MLHDLNLDVSTDRFDRAMDLAARDMGGTYDRTRGLIKLPASLRRPGDRTLPTELEVHYRKFPCGMMMREFSESMPGVGAPCVSFDVIPRVPGDPRRSRIYQSFQGDAKHVKTLFGKFLVWLKIVSKALRRYADGTSDVEFGRSLQARLGSRSIDRVAHRWLRARGVR